MSRLLSGDLVPVSIGPCECPGSPHQEDQAWLKPRLTAAGGMEASAIIGNGANYANTAALGRDLGMAYLIDGLEKWNILDDDGKPIPCTREMLESGRLDWETTLMPIGDAAADLYSESVMRPLVRRVEELTAQKKADEEAEAAKVVKPSRKAKSQTASGSLNSGATTTPEPISAKST